MSVYSFETKLLVLTLLLKVDILDLLVALNILADGTGLTFFY